MNEYNARCIRQFQANVHIRNNSDRIVGCGFGLFDLFSGIGWKNHSRFRVVRTKSAPQVVQLIQVGGIPLSQEYRRELLKEMS